MKNLLFLLLCYLAVTNPAMGQCDNHALDFDGSNDYITLNPLPSSFTPNADFTVQMWFRSDATGGTNFCSGDFRRLFVLGGTSRFEIGECNGLMSIYWYDGSSFGPLNMSTVSIRDNQWHCISVVRSGTNVDVWLDGGAAPYYSATGLGTLNSTLFRVGHWGGSATPGQDWDGPIDEVRLWNIALPTAQLTTCDPCLLTGDETGLVVNWNFDQGIELANNVGILLATDPNGNNGLINPSSNGGFTFLPGNVSNFICSDAELVYPNLIGSDLELRGILPSTSGLLTGICSGDPVHFCLKQNGATPQPPPGMTVVWEFNDDATGWQTVTDPAFIGLCFVVPSVTADCSSANPDGYTDREYRANITVIDPLLGNCTYTSDVYPIRICCPIPASTVNIGVVPPAMLNGTLCDGDVADFNVILSPAPFIGSATTITWYDQNNNHLTAYDNLSSFTMTGVTVGVPNICFKAIVTHCTKTATFEQCITVDPVPVCGTIDRDPACTTLTSITTCPANTICYSICPGDDAFLYQATPFQNCNPQWEYTFDHTTWYPLGFSNTVQNTNELPGDWAWPTTLDPVFYRIKCHPLHTPSGCEPCLSKEVRIEFISPPPSEIITGDDQICVADAGTTLSVTNPNTAFTYTWYWNGLEVQTGASSTYYATMAGNYWVDISNGCQITQTLSFHLDICEVIAVISCPLSPNECAYLGDPISLNACIGTINTCGGSPSTFGYAWSWVDEFGATQTRAGCAITDTPPSSGTTYTVVVTDPATGCIDTTSMTVIPCLP